MAVFDSTMVPVSKEDKLFLDCDIGFDSDDYWALYLLASSGRLYGVSTTFYRPGEKARIVKVFLQELRSSGLTEMDVDDLSRRVFAGDGYWPQKEGMNVENRELFTELYPRWPRRFGDPTAPNDEDYQCVFPYQTTPFEDLGSYQREETPSVAEVDPILEALKETIKKNVFVATGPLTNIATLLRRNPELMKEKVKSIVMMNGRRGSPLRMGYNGGLNLKDTETVLSSGIPCVIVPSSLCQKFNLPLEKVKQIEEALKSPMGETMLKMLMNWEVHRARKRNPDMNPENVTIHQPILADPLTAYLALNPERIKNVQAVKYTFDHSLEGVDLLHDDAHQAVVVEDVEKSSVVEVREVHNSEQIQEELMGKIMALYRAQD